MQKITTVVRVGSLLCLLGGTFFVLLLARFYFPMPLDYLGTAVLAGISCVMSAVYLLRYKPQWAYLVFVVPSLIHSMFGSDYIRSKPTLEYFAAGAQWFCVAMLTIASILIVVSLSTEKKRKQTGRSET